jgi:uncharacterized protein (DUF1778 family)
VKILPTESLTHNFVINDTETAERFAEALDKPKYEKSNIKAEYIRSPEELKLLYKKMEVR